MNVENHQPLASAVAATAVQFICSPFVAVDLFARVNAIMLGVAILQNLLADRDPQLALLYTLIAATLAPMGGGRYSLDAWLEHRWSHSISKRI